MSFNAGTFVFVVGKLIDDFIQVVFYYLIMVHNLLIEFHKVEDFI